MANEEYDPTVDEQPADEPYVPIDDPNDPRLKNTPLNEPDNRTDVRINEDQNWPGTPAQPRNLGRRELVHEGIKRTGASPVAQAAWMGDAEQESTFNARAVSDHGSSFGLFQIGRPMYGNYRREVQPKSEEEDLYLQPQYVIDQWKRRHPERWKAMNEAPNAAEAEYIFRSTPGWGYGIAGKRYQHAMNYQRTLGVRDLDNGVRNLDAQENWPGTPEGGTSDEAQPETQAKGEPPQPIDPAVTPPEDVFLQGVLQKHLRQGAAQGVYPKAERALPAELGVPTTPDFGWPEASKPSDVYGQFGTPDTPEQVETQRRQREQREPADAAYDQSPMPPEMVDTLKDVWKSGVRQGSKELADINPVVATLQAIPQTRFIANGIREGVGELGAGFVGDTDNLALIAASEGLGLLPVGAGVAGRAVSGYFAYQMAKQLPELWQQFKDAPDAQSKIAVATQGVGQLVMTAQAGMHAVGPGGGPPGYFKKIQAGEEAKARAKGDAFAKGFEQGYQEEPAPETKTLSPDDRGMLHDEEQHYSDNEILDPFYHPEGKKNPDGTYKLKTAQSTPEARAHAQELAQTLQDGDRVTEAGDEDSPSWVVQRIKSKKTGRESISIQSEKGGEPVGYGRQEVDADGNPTGPIIMDANGNSILQRSRIERKAADTGRNKNLPDWAREEIERRGGDPRRTFNDVDLANPSIIKAINEDPTLDDDQKSFLLKTGVMLPKAKVATPGAGGTVTPITAEAPKFKGEPSSLFEQFSQYMRQVQPQTGTGKPTFAEWQRGQRKGSIGKLPEPVVPGTGPEDRSRSMLDEIRNAKADTTAKVQALFARPEQGGHSFTREQAADLRRQAWGEQVAKPDRSQPANKVLQGQRNKIAQRRFQTDYDNLPEGGQLAVDLERRHQPKAIESMSEDELHAGIQSVDSELASTPDTPGIINKAGLLRVMKSKMRTELGKRGVTPAPRTRPGEVIPQNEVGFREDASGRLVRDAEGNIIQENEGKGRFPAIENTYHIAYAAEQAFPGVPFKELQVVGITDERAGRAGNRPTIANRIIRRGDKAAEEAIRKEFPVEDDYGQWVSTPKPYKARKGDVPSYEEWKKGKKQEPPPPPPTAPGAPPVVPRTGPAAPPVTGFQTSSGSHYEVHDDGTTSRNKAPRKEDPTDYGPKERSSKTVYVTPENMRFLALPQSGWRLIDHGDGTFSLATLHEGKLGIPPSSRNIHVLDTPAIGLHPLELWSKSEVKGQDAYGKAHIGNDITTLGGERPKAPPLPPTPRELQSGASREQVQADLAAGNPVNAFDVFGHKLEDELPGGYVRKGDNFEKTAQPSKTGHYPNRNGVYPDAAANDWVQARVGKLAWQNNRIHVAQLQDGNWIYSVESGLSGGGHGMSESFGTFETSDEAWEAAIEEMKRGAESLIARPDGGKAQVAIAKKTLKWLEDVVSRHIKMPTDRFNKLYDKVVAEDKAEDERVPFVAPHPREMTHAQINNELDRLDKTDVELSKELTAAGRGKEMPAEIRTKDDMLSKQFSQVLDRKKALIDEAARRLGGVRPSLDRLPVGKYSSRNPVTLIPPDKKGTNPPWQRPAGAKKIETTVVKPSTLPPDLKAEVEKLEKKKTAPTTTSNMVVQKKYLLKALDDSIQAAPDVPEFEMPDDIVADRKALTAAAKERQKKPYGDENAGLKADQEQQQMLSDQIDKYGLNGWKVKELSIRPDFKPQGERVTPQGSDWQMTEREPKHDELMKELETRIKSAEDKAVPKVVIEVPGDGTFSIVNSKEALKTFRKAAAKDFPSTLAKSSEPSKGKSTKPSQIPAVSKGAKSLEDKVKVASIAASTDKTRYVLEGTVHSTGDKLISTDGRRMIIIDHDGPKDRILDGKTGKERTDWGEDDKGKKNPKPTYPNWKAVVPEKKDMKKVATVDTAEGIKLMKQAVQLAGDKNKVMVKLWVDKNGKLGVTAKTPEVGEFAGGEADPKTAKYLMTLDPEFIADGLKIARGLGHDKVELWVKRTETEMSPMSLEAKGMRYIQMPVRISDGGTYSVKGVQLPSGAEQVHPMSPEAEPVPETPEVDPAAAFTAPAQADARAAQETNELGLTPSEQSEYDKLYSDGMHKDLPPADEKRFKELAKKIDASGNYYQGPGEHGGTEEHGFGGGPRKSKSQQGFQPGPTNTPEQEKATMVERLAGSPLNPVGIVKSLLSLVAPGVRGPKYVDAASELGRHLGKMHRRGEITMSELKKYERMFDKLGVDRAGVPPEQNIGNKFASDLSMGRPIHPQFQEAWDKVEELLKSKLYALHSAGAGLKSLREHYFPGMWDQRSRMAFNAAVEEAIAQGVIDKNANLNRVTTEQAAWIKDRTDRHYDRGTGNSDRDMIGYLSRNPMRGRESFRKQKVFEDYLQAQRLGLRPVSYNPITVMKLKFAELDRSIMANEYFQSLKNKGLMEVIGPWEKIPEGWQKVPDPYGEIIGPPTVTIKEWLDRGVYDGLEKALTNIGGYHIRKIGIGGQRLGYAQSAAGGQFSGGKTVTRFGTETSVLAHEVGHQLDFKFGLWDTLVRGAEGIGARGEVTKAASQAARVKINNELRAIADLTGRGAYARGQKEKMAQVLEAYIHAPDMMKDVAPTVYSKFDEFVKATPQIAHLADLRPGLLLKQLESQKYVGMPIMGVRIIPTEHATIMDNYLSKSLYNSQYVGALYKGWMGAANSINQSQLGMGSAFHLTFTLADAVTSNFANVLKDGYGVMTGSRTAEDLVRTTGRAIGTVARTPYLGDKVLNAWRNSEPSMDARIVQVVRAGELAGAGFELQKGMETEQWGKMMKDWYSGRKAMSVLRSPVAVTEALAWPIMKWWVPRLKAGVFADMAWRVIEQNPGRTMEEMTPQFRQVWNRVDARLGQVVYDRLFMRNAAKNTLQALIRAPGWTGGTIVEVGGAFPDAAKFVGDWIKDGHPPRELPDRVAYTMALLIGSTITNGLLTYAFTGERPRGLDYWAFRDGGTDEFGNPTRLMLPTYMKDILSYVEHPGTTLGHKLHPLLSVANDVILQNKDYYGTEIRHPDDPLYQQAGQVGKYLLKSFEPFWWRGLRRQYAQQGGVKSGAVESYFGIMPAPRSLTETPAEKYAADRQRAMLPQGARTQAQADHSANVREAIRDIQLKRTTVQEALRSGRISQSDKKNVEFSSKAPALTRAIAHMGPEDVYGVWKRADPDERRQIKQLFLDKIKRSKTLTKQRQNELFRLMNQ